MKVAPRWPKVEQAQCDFLPWDSAHFGLPIGRVRGERLDDGRAAAIDRWCSENGVRCLYFLADPDDAATVRAAARHGYTAVDVRVTLRHGLAGLPGNSLAGSSVDVREATEGDLPPLRTLATRSHHATRFYSDGAFPRDRCDELYAAWVESGVRNPDQTVLVLDTSRGIAGYEVICHPDSSGTARLDLIAVVGDHRRRGVGRGLLNSSLCWVADRGATVAFTATQGRNVASMRAHEDVGFEIERSGIWHHKWYPGESADP